MTKNATIVDTMELGLKPQKELSEYTCPVATELKKQIRLGVDAATPALQYLACHHDRRKDRGEPYRLPGLTIDSSGEFWDGTAVELETLYPDHGTLLCAVFLSDGTVEMSLTGRNCLPNEETVTFSDTDRINNFLSFHDDIYA